MCMALKLYWQHQFILLYLYEWEFKKKKRWKPRDMPWFHCHLWILYILTSAVILSTSKDNLLSLKLRHYEKTCSMQPLFEWLYHATLANQITFVLACSHLACSCLMLYIDIWKALINNICTMLVQPSANSASKPSPFCLQEFKSV